jgi:hypothetical protein
LKGLGVLGNLASKNVCIPRISCFKGMCAVLGHLASKLCAFLGYLASKRCAVLGYLASEMCAVLGYLPSKGFMKSLDTLLQMYVRSPWIS